MYAWSLNVSFFLSVRHRPTHLTEVAKGIWTGKQSLSSIYASSMHVVDNFSIYIYQHIHGDPVLIAPNFFASYINAGLQFFTTHYSFVFQDGYQRAVLLRCIIENIVHNLVKSGDLSFKV